MTPEQLTEVDAHILAGHVLIAVKSICKHTGIGIKGAIDIHFDRYKKLRLANPADFKCTDEEYWQGVYS